MGKFNRIDPQVLNDVVKVLSDPQALNAYAYARNNPIRYVDPTGETYAEASWGYLVGWAKGLWGTLTASYYALIYPDATKEVIMQKAKQAVVAWRATFTDLFSNSTQVGSEILEGLGITYEEFIAKSDYEKGEIIGQLSEAAAEIVAAKKLTEIKSFRASVNKNIHWGQQNKHIIGANNYIEGKSILTHSDPQALVNRFSGTGRKIYNNGRAEKEIVDFGEDIGKFVDQSTGEVFATTRGQIIYSEEGAHIVPLRPN